MANRAAIVICGAGFAGISAAFHLAVRKGVADVVLVDEREPLTLSSNKGTEGYRNWWPGPDDLMIRFMNRSIDLLEGVADESGNIFDLNRRGYVFLSSEPGRLRLLHQEARVVAALGAGEVRLHDHAGLYAPSPVTGYGRGLDGADLLRDGTAVREMFPYLTADVAGMLHVRRAGWFDSQQLGHWLLDQAQTAGVRLVRDRVTGVDVTGGRVVGVTLAGGEKIATDTFVIAAGPHLRSVGRLLDIDLPVFNELHGKLSLRDSQQILPAEAPLLIWSDPVVLPWRDAERDVLLADQSTAYLTRPLPAGVHVRPRDKDLLIVWTFKHTQGDFHWPPRYAPYYGEVLLRALARMLPAVTGYFGRGAGGKVDGAYYCKTRENRPLIGPLPVDGAYVIGALSGYGLMGSQAAGELLAAHVTGGALPDYAPDLALSRYENPDFVTRYADWSATAGQL